MHILAVFEGSNDKKSMLCKLQDQTAFNATTCQVVHLTNSL